MNSSYPSHLTLGLQVYVKGRENPKAGVVRFIGPTSFASGYWVGLELPTPEGKNNGTVQGVTYFTCKDQCGLFVRPSLVGLMLQSPSRLSALTFIDRDRREKLCGLMKLKVSLTMDILSQQLDMIEELEKIGLDASSNESDREITLKSKELLALCDQERLLWENFNAKLHSLR